MAREPIPTWCFALAVVRRNDQFLIVHECKQGQQWFLPAGRVEPGETFATAACRETLEEAGIPIRVVGVLRVEHSPSAVGARFRVVFLAEPVDDTPPKSVPDEDCAIVFGAIHGWDGRDSSAVDRPFTWPCPRDMSEIKVGYFEGSTKKAELDVLKKIGVKLVPIQLPSKYPVDALTTILHTEAAAVFDELTRKDVKESLDLWNTSFRAGQFVPAIEYLRANRVRSLVMKEMDEVMAQVHCYVGGNDLVLTNLTGHPTIVMPNGFTKTPVGELPYSITFTGRLYGETELLAVGHAYQQATGHHLRHPMMEKPKEK